MKSDNIIQLRAELESLKNDFNRKISSLESRITALESSSPGKILLLIRQRQFQPGLLSQQRRLFLLHQQK